MTAVYLLMGVSGSGKSTVGRALAAQLDCPFYDADDFHSMENVAKMAGGLPLSDEERWPWLERLAQLIADQLQHGETAVLACSALKKSYRDRLRQGKEGLVIIYLHGSFDVIWGRIQQREDHYMKASLLRSQFDILEEPDREEAISVNINDETKKIVSLLIKALAKDSFREDKDRRPLSEAAKSMKFADHIRAVFGWPTRPRSSAFLSGVMTGETIFVVVGNPLLSSPWLG